MDEKNKDVLMACCILALGIFSFYVSAKMEIPIEFIESPGIFPGLMSVLMTILGTFYFIRSIRRGGRIKPIQFAKSAVTFFKSEENRPIITGILFPGIYVFIGIPFIGFYFSSALFMGVMFYLYVKRWKRWVVFPVSIGITVILYLIFTVLFRAQIW